MQSIQHACYVTPIKQIDFYSLKPGTCTLIYCEFNTASCLMQYSANFWQRKTLANLANH